MMVQEDPSHRQWVDNGCILNLGAVGRHDYRTSGTVHQETQGFAKQDGTESWVGSW